MENMNESFDKFNVETFFSNNEYFSSSDEEEEELCKNYHYMLLKGASEGFHSASGDADVEVPSNLELLNYVLSHADKYDKKELLEMSSKLGRRLKFRKCMEQKNKIQAAARAEAANAQNATPKSEPPAKPDPVEKKAVAASKDDQKMPTPDFEVKKAALEKRKQDFAAAAGAAAAVAASAREHKYPVVPTVNLQNPPKSEMEFLEFLKFQQQMVASRTQLVTAVAAAMQAKAAAAAVPPSNSSTKPDPFETVSSPRTPIKLDIPNYHPPSRDDILYPTVILFQDGFKMGFHRIHKRDPEPQELPNQQIIVQEFVANNVRPGPDAVRLAHPMGEIMALKMAKEHDPNRDLFKHEKK